MGISIRRMKGVVMMLVVADANDDGGDMWRGWPSYTFMLAMVLVSAAGVGAGGSEVMAMVIGYCLGQRVLHWTPIAGGPSSRFPFRGSQDLAVGEPTWSFWGLRVLQAEVGADNLLLVGRQ